MSPSDSTVINTVVYNYPGCISHLRNGISYALLCLIHFRHLSTRGQGRRVCKHVGGTEWTPSPGDGRFARF